MENTKNNIVKNELKEEKIISLRKINLDREQLLIHDSKLADLMQKPFDEMSEEELRKLCLCKAKVVKNTTRDRFGTVSQYFQAQFILVNGVVFKKNLNDSEVLSISNFAPELITEGKSKVLIPVKLLSFVNKNGKRVFNYTACLCPGVYVGTSRKNKADNGYIDDKTINNIIAYNLENKSRPETQIKFIDIEESRFERYKSSINDELETQSLEDF